MKLLIQTDGGSRGNPGPSASGYVIYDEQGKLLEAGGEYLGVTTNNQAEYRAILLALEKAAKYEADSIEFKLDSELAVKQLNGIYKIKNKDLLPITRRIKFLASSYSRLTFAHVMREHNVAADAEVNRILDRQAGKSPL